MEELVVREAKTIVAKAMLETYNLHMSLAYPRVKQEMFEMVHCMQWPANFDALHPTAS